MKIIESYCTGNKCYKDNKLFTVKGLMLHSVGCSQPDPKVFVNTFNKKTDGVCVHAFLDNTGSVYQTLPWNVRAGHCGSGAAGSANNTHIGVEMTEPNTITYTGGSGWTDKDPVKTKEFVLGTYKTAVELFAKLCLDFKLDPLKDGVIISHAEGYKRGLASNHGDVEHIWNKFGLTMAGFRSDVKKAMQPVTIIDIGETVDNLLNDGVITDRAYWAGVLIGTIQCKPEWLKLVFDRYHEKV